MAGRLLLSLALVLLLLGAGGCGGDGSSSPAATREQEAALSHYESFLRKNSATLDRRVAALVATTEAKSLPDAESAYVLARVSYGHLDPAAASVEPLRGRIDGLEEEVPPDEYGGFHEIEKWFFWEFETGVAKAAAMQLQLDVRDLDRRIGSTTFKPGQIVAGAAAVLDRIVAKDFPGASERYAHCDLVDTAAKLEGVGAAFEALAPLLSENDPQLARRIEAQLRRAYAGVGEYGTLAREQHARGAGINFVRYDQLYPGAKWKLVRPFKSLAHLFDDADTLINSS